MAGFALKLINKGLAERYKRMARKLPQVVDDTIHDMAEEVQTEYEVTTDTWDTRVVFKVKRIGLAHYTITYVSRIYTFVDKGTRAHTITAKTASRLMFPANYVAKTSPGIFGSTPGGSSGDIISRRTVRHPGTWARNFTRLLSKRYNSKYVAKRVRKELDRGIQSLGL